MARIRLLGQGIGYSASVAMQSAALEALGLRHRYELADVTPDRLADTVVELRQSDHLGANVTTPHKGAVLPLLDEVEPLADEPPAALAGKRVLVAGIGNIFLADDGFGVAVARRLAERPQPGGVEVKDFGIRGLDLVYALGDGHDAAILIDAVPRGEAPGTLFVIEPEIAEEHVGLDAHGMDPAKVLALARDLGRVPERVLLIGCEPEVKMDGTEDEVVGELSEPVAAAVERAVELVDDLVAQLSAEQTEHTDKRRT